MLNMYYIGGIMNISYLGHSCFLIESNKLKLLTDPNKFIIEKLRRKNILDKITHITISHNHFDHSFVQCFDQELVILNSEGDYEDDYLKAWSFLSFHDNVGGLKRGKNIIFKFEIDGFMLCHLGDLGHKLSPEMIDNLGALDILFIPVGGNITIDGLTASTITRTIGAKISIPMHFKTSEMLLPIDGLESFLYRINLPISHVKNLDLKRESDLPSENNISILSWY